MGLLISLTTAAFGAVMLTQWVIDPENAALPFRLLGITLLALGIIGVVWLYVLMREGGRENGEVQHHER